MPKGDGRRARDAERRKPRPLQLLRRETLPVHLVRIVRRGNNPARGPPARTGGHLSGMRRPKPLAGHLRPVPLSLPGARRRGGTVSRGRSGADARAGRRGPSEAAHQRGIGPGLPRPSAEGPRPRPVPGPGADRPRIRCPLEDRPDLGRRARTDPGGRARRRAQDEYECPLCGCITSMFAAACLECGAAFDEEEMDEAIRQQFAAEGDAALIAFYDARLAEKPENADLLYARGLLLQTMGRTDEAMAALDRAAAAAPDERKIKVAQLRIQAKELRKPDAAEKLRSTASSLLDDVAWDQEIAQLDDLLSEEGPTCPSCGSTVPRSVALCPSCGARLVAALPEPEQKRAPGGAPELDILVDDLLVGELEKSLSPEELELTKAAVLDWLIEELEETMGVDATIKAAAEKRDETKAPAEPSPVPPAIGFLSGWIRGSKGLVSGARPKTTTRGAGKVNGLVNGRGRVNGLVNGLGRTNGLVNGVGRVNGLVTPTGRVNGLMGEQGRVNGTIGGTRSVRAGRKEIHLSVPTKRVRYAAIAAATLVAILVDGRLFIGISGAMVPIV